MKAETKGQRNKTYYYLTIPMCLLLISQCHLGSVVGSVQCGAVTIYAADVVAFCCCLLYLLCLLFLKCNFLLFWFYCVIFFWFCYYECSCKIACHIFSRIPLKTQPAVVVGLSRLGKNHDVWICIIKKFYYYKLIHDKKTVGILHDFFFDFH